MAYKIGDKFVIEIDSVMTNKNGTLYGIKGFKSLVFDDYGLEQLERIPGEDDCIKVGDVVFSDATGDHAVVTRVDGDRFCLLFDDGSCGEHSQTYERWKKAEAACHLDLHNLFDYIRKGGK
jgi:hypothetical protein